jgi:hypothetical protein
MESRFQFLGPGLFDLPVAQSATATPGSDAVTVSFRVLVNPSQVAVVRIAVVNSVALELAAAIATAATSRE